MGPLAIVQMAQQALEHLAAIRKALEQLVEQQKGTG